MCGYSLENQISRDAQQGDKIRSTSFMMTPTMGFCSVDDRHVAVCLKPGTELSFERPVGYSDGIVRMIGDLFAGRFSKAGRKRRLTATFCQVGDNPNSHRDALLFPDGRIVRLQSLHEGQVATVLQLPAQPLDAKQAALKNPARELEILENV